ncbi:phage protein [Methylobacter sp. Wu8]|uniref:phage protein n=1 Tax=Methylobacter sp. Wu8 TaxID=3118457 RepID=UPI002F335C94
MAKKGNHLSGQDFDVMFGDAMVHVENLSASISDNRKAVQTRGIPDGYVNGDVACTGDLEIDSANLTLLIDSARSSGSFRELPPFDIVCVGKTIDHEQKIELFGCLLSISDLFNLDGKGGEKNKHKIKFEVTSPDFVRIDGVPYLSAKDIRDL